MEAYGWVEVWLHSFLATIQYEGEWSDSSFGRFTLEKIFPSACQEGSWLGLRICPKKRKAFAPSRNGTWLLRRLASYMFYRQSYFGLEATYSVNKLSEEQKFKQYVY
jgi:hypothetical protein